MQYNLCALCTVPLVTHQKDEKLMFYYGHFLHNKVSVLVLTKHDLVIRTGKCLQPMHSFFSIPLMEL